MHYSRGRNLPGRAARGSVSPRKVACRSQARLHALSAGPRPPTRAKSHGKGPGLLVRTRASRVLGAKSLAHHSRGLRRQPISSSTDASVDRASSGERNGGVLVQCTPTFIGSSKNYKSRQLKSSLQLITGAIPQKIRRLVPSYHHRTHDFHHYFGSLLIPPKLLFG